MKIGIDTSVGISMIDEGDSMDSLAFINDLCCLRRLGHALVLIKKKTALLILKSKKLNILNERIVSRLNQDSTFINQVAEYNDARVVYFHSDYSDFEQIPSNYIDIKGYINSNLIISHSHLVLEDIVDDYVYSVIGKWSIKNKEEYLPFHVFYEPKHGGGSRTPVVCQHLINDNKATFSICDSDKKTPDCNIGETARDTLAVFVNNQLSDNYFQLDAHEVENLLPIDLLIHKAREEQTPALLFLQSTAQEHPNAYIYYDMKNGFKYKDVYQNEGNIKAYWQDIYEGSDGILEFKRQLSSGEKNDRSVIFNKLSSMSNL